MPMGTRSFSKTRTNLRKKSNGWARARSFNGFSRNAPKNPRPRRWKIIAGPSASRTIAAETDRAPRGYLDRTARKITVPPIRGFIMFRTLIGLMVALVVTFPIYAQEGAWRLSYITNGATENTAAIVQLKLVDGKLHGELVAASPR